MTPSPTTVLLRSDHITLAQALKVAGLVDSGGQAKNLIREGLVLVNGVAELQPGKKLHAGDRFAIPPGVEWVITAS